MLKLRPELCSLDVGSMDFGPHVFVNYSAHVDIMAEQIRDAGVIPELEVFSLGHIEIAKRLIETGRVKKPPLFQLCMGIPWGIPANTQNMVSMVQALPKDAIWAGFGVSAAAFHDGAVRDPGRKYQGGHGGYLLSGKGGFGPRATGNWWKKRFPSYGFWAKSLPRR